MTPMTASPTTAPQAATKTTTKTTTKTKTTTAAATELREVIGQLGMQNQPLQLSHLFPLLDMTAGRCAALYARGSVMTGCFDSVSVHDNAVHGDVVTARAIVVAVGSRSMLVHIELFREPRLNPMSMKPAIPLRIVSAYSTFVATQRTERLPMPGSNGLSAGANGEDLQGKFRQMRMLLEKADTSTVRKVAKETEAWTTLSNHEARAWMQWRLPISETTMTFRKHFLPRNLNHGGVVFGGDILDELDRCANACATRALLGVAGGLGMSTRTKDIRALSFRMPVKSLDMLSVKCRVVATWKRVAAVSVRTTVHTAELARARGGRETDDDDDGVPCGHCGVFFVEVDDDDVDDEEGFARFGVGVEDAKRVEMEADELRQMYEAVVAASDLSW